MRNISLAIILSILLMQEGLPEDRFAIAIPQFKNNSETNEQDWLDEALTDMLTTDISRSKEVTVVARRELKEIIEEQKLALSGLLDESTTVEIGNLVGANTILYCTYTIVQSDIRLDAKGFDVESGTIVLTASAQGKMADVLSIEKELVLDIFNNMDIQLDNNTLEVLMEKPTNSIHAVSNNYKGILALEKKKFGIAEIYFQKAIEYDPSYIQAKENYSEVSEIILSRGALYADLQKEIAQKEYQQNELEMIMDRFINTIWEVSIIGAPEPIINNQPEGFASLQFQLSFSASENALQSLSNALAEISAGKHKLHLPSPNPVPPDPQYTSLDCKERVLKFLEVMFGSGEQPKDSNINAGPHYGDIYLYEENWKWLEEKYFDAQPTLWFKKDYYFHFYEEESPISKHFAIWVANYGWFNGTHVNISYGIRETRGPARSGRGRTVKTTIPRIPLADIERITRVELK